MKRLGLQPSSRRAVHSPAPAYRAYTQETAWLTLRDHGTHLKGALRCHGPLDEANFDQALDWVRRVYREHFTKPVILDTRRGQVLLVKEDGQVHCERLMRRRVS